MWTSIFGLICQQEAAELDDIEEKQEPNDVTGGIEEEQELET